MFIRRAVSLTMLALVASVLFGLFPLLLLISLVLSVIPGLRSLPHALLFAVGFVVFECVGVARLTWVWLRYRNQDDYLAHNQNIQYWWASGLLKLGEKIYKLTFTVTGEDAIQGPSALLIVRHTSIGDTVLPMIYFAQQRGESLRYVLKKELTVMPCLDIAGHRLPNLFVDRSGTDTQAELQAIQDLTAGAGPTDSVLIYPEGTRFTLRKQADLKANKPELLEKIERWPNLLPPRLGGTKAMLEANPGKDVVMLSHVGFEGAASLSDMLNGRWVRQVVKMHFWRIPNADIGKDYEQFLYTQWDHMQASVIELSS